MRDDAYYVVASLLEEEARIVLAVLTPESQKRLLEAFPPVHPKVYAHHMTMAFKPDPTILQRYAKMEGRTVQLRVFGQAQDDKAQAVVVYGQSTNPVPHITISVAEGVKPSYSNDLLAGGWEPVEFSLSVEAVVTVENL